MQNNLCRLVQRHLAGCCNATPTGRGRIRVRVIRGNTWTICVLAHKYDQVIRNNRRKRNAGEQRKGIACMINGREWYYDGLNDLSYDRPRLKSWMQHIGAFNDFKEPEYRVRYIKSLMGECVSHFNDLFGEMPESERFRHTTRYIEQHFSHILMAHYTHDFLGPAWNECLINIGTADPRNYSRLFLFLCHPSYYASDFKSVIHETMIMYLSVLEISRVMLGRDESQALHECFSKTLCELDNIDLYQHERMAKICMDSRLTDILDYIDEEHFAGRRCEKDIDEIARRDLLDWPKEEYDMNRELLSYVLADAAKYESNPVPGGYRPYDLMYCATYCGYYNNQAYYNRAYSARYELGREIKCRIRTAQPLQEGSGYRWLMKRLAALLKNGDPGLCNTLIKKVKSEQGKQAETIISETRTAMRAILEYASKTPGGLKGFGALCRNAEELRVLSGLISELDTGRPGKYCGIVSCSVWAAFNNGYRAFSNLLLSVLLDKKRSPRVTVRHAVIVLEAIEYASVLRAKKFRCSNSGALEEILERTAEEMKYPEIRKYRHLSESLSKSEMFFPAIGCFGMIFRDIKKGELVRYTEEELAEHLLSNKTMLGYADDDIPGENVQKIWKELVDDYRDYAQHNATDFYQPAWIFRDSIFEHTALSILEDWLFYTTIQEIENRIIPDDQYYTKYMIADTDQQD